MRRRAQARFDGSHGDTGRDLSHARIFTPQDDHLWFSRCSGGNGVGRAPRRACRLEQGACWTTQRAPRGAIVVTAGPKGTGQVEATTEYENRLVRRDESPPQGARHAGADCCWKRAYWKPMGFSPSDMEFQPLQRARRARKWRWAFGVLRRCCGIAGDADYCNYQEAHRAFYRFERCCHWPTRLAAAPGGWLRASRIEAVTLKPDLASGVGLLAQERDAQWRGWRGADFLSRRKSGLCGLPRWRRMG